jgi:hypothetical protein
MHRLFNIQVCSIFLYTHKDDVTVLSVCFGWHLSATPERWPWVKCNTVGKGMNLKDIPVEL